MSARKRTHLAPSSEEELVDLILRHIRRTFGRGTRVASEVRSHGRFKTDVCVYADGSIFAIEAKLVHWRRALGQARLNSFYADRSYIALWEPMVRDGIVHEARQHGIGVIGVGRSRMTVINALEARSPNPDLRSRILASAFGA